MTDEFDPYYIWLSIPPGEQPPNHYRLLGIPVFESHGDVIRNAADQRMAHLKTFGAGQHSELSQTLLTEVSAAKVCLLNEAKKQEYDDQLRRQTHARAGAEPEEALQRPPVRSAAAELSLGRPPLIVEPKPPRRIARKVNPRRRWILRFVDAAALILLVLGARALLVPGIGVKGPDPPRAPQEEDPEPGPKKGGQSTELWDTTNEITLNKWFDLLPYVDVSNHRIRGHWVKERTSIKSSAAPNCCIVLPVKVDGSYDLRVEFMRTSGTESVNVIFPVQSRLCNLVLSGRSGAVGGFDMVDSCSLFNNPNARVPDKLVNVQRYTVSISVDVLGSDNVQVRANLDGRPYPEWKGAPSSLSLARGWKLPWWLMRPALGANEAVTFYSDSLRMRSGQARLDGPNTTEPCVMTDDLGGGGAYDKVAFYDLAPEGGYLIGFRGTETTGCITGIQPIYATAKGHVYGGESAAVKNDFKVGTFVGKEFEVKASEGYAVAGIAVKAADVVTGMQLLYMRVAGDSLDSRETKTSEWIGGGSVNWVGLLGCTGNRIIGIHGASGDYPTLGQFVPSLRSIGLIVERRGTTIRFIREWWVSLTKEIGYQKAEAEEFGTLDLAKYITPRNLATGYARTYIYSDRPQAALLKTSRAGSITAWLNGHRILSENARGWAWPDKHTIQVKLEQGWNHLLIEVDQERPQWHLYCRLVAPDGKPLEDVRCALAHD